MKQDLRKCSRILSLRDERGMSLIAILLIVGLITAGAASFSSLFLNQLKGEQNVNIQQSADLVKRNVMSVITHDGAWLQTIQAAPQLACLRTEGAVCNPSPPNDKISLFLSDGTDFIGATTPNVGLDRLGNRCTTFNATEGNDDCPFRFTLTWSCKGGACPATRIDTASGVPSQPQIVLSGSMEFKPKTKGPEFNLKAMAYNFSFVRGEEEEYLSSACKTLGGYYDQNAEHCSVFKVSVFCDPVREFFAGLDGSGNPICRQKPLLGFECPAANAVTGVDANGGLICWKF